MLLLAADLAAQNGAIEDAAAFSGDDLSALPRGDWITNGGNVLNQRYSPLTGFNCGNVGELKALWRTGMGTGGAQNNSGQVQILAYSGVLYVINGADDIFAMDVDTGAILWTYHGVPDSRAGSFISRSSRGLALGDGKVFAGLLDARLVARYRDYHEIDNLQSAYGYYLDKNLWNDLANLFAEDSSMELAQRGVYSGPGRVRGFLLNVFGRGGEGPVEGQLGNHIQLAPVIHVSPDGQTAQVRSRMLQQMSRGDRASWGAAIYENEAVREDGRWKLSSVHAYNTWGGGYDDGWVRNASGFVPGPSADFPPDAPPTLVFRMWPTVYPIPFHYENPAAE